MVLRPVTSPFTSDFDTLVHEQLQKWKVPGLTIAIVHGSSTYSKAYGMASFPNKPMTPDALFSACSTTKAFTAAAVSLAIDDSRNTTSPISWTTPLSSIIRDDFVLANESATNNTTLEDALSHRAGLPGHELAMMMADPREILRHEVRKLRSLALSDAPRTVFRYCNHMYMVASYALEKLAGRGLSTVLRERIWSLLGMHDTYFNIHEARKSPGARERLVTGYTYVPEKESYAAEPHLDYAPTTGAGSMVSNVLDYAKWVRSLIYRTGPMSNEGYTALFTPRTIIATSGSGSEDGIFFPDANVPYHLYALGWFVDQVCGERFYWHSGSWPGFGIMVGLIPEREWGFAMMGNAVDARHVERELYLYLIERLVGCSSPSLSDRPSAQKQAERSRSESLAQAKCRLYPILPASPIPHSLPLREYAGVYSHQGYGSFELVVEGGKLVADLTDRVGRLRFLLEHASGEFFVCAAYTPEKGLSLGEKFQTEFYVDLSGVVASMGLDLEPALGGEKIWFEREIG
ncbi:beta-lactamase/transpeptidase-like protein [Aspergillus affinis]|uniref:beta-lactamase/transpeptidase-like protein n=1 Tax=Aspergillus affinis TaxID=1070780 RepID=UPI0022FDC1FD|nr:beta-lactamase/transpeptidase-like protein [Aspergillus affinis]KAI9043580.1 beta-lactamase/transpeptidase-like protein [Aspergillus affinis]